MTNTKPIYRMSSAGYCPKKLSAIRLGKEPEPAPKWLETAAEEGNWHEARIKEQLTNEGFKIVEEQLECTIEQKAYNLIGHIDGMIMPEDESFHQLLEVKSMSQYEFDRWMKGGFAAFPHYAGQLACYFAATGLNNALYIVKNRNSGYTDRRELKVTDNGLFAIQPILDKIAEVEELALEGQLYPAEYDVENIECRRCEYKHLCLPEPKEINGVDSRVLQMAVDRWREGKLLADRGKRLMENAKKEILEPYAKAQPELKFRFDEVSVNMVSVKETHIEYDRKAYNYCKIDDLRTEDNGK